MINSWCFLSSLIKTEQTQLWAVMFPLNHSLPSVRVLLCLSVSPRSKAQRKEDIKVSVRPKNKESCENKVIVFSDKLRAASQLLLVK